MFISQFILGLVIPATLSYLYCPFINKVSTIISNVSSLYLSILCKIQDDYKNNLLIQLFSPSLAFGKLIVTSCKLLYSYFTFVDHSDNVIIFNNSILISYVYKNKKYMILTLKKAISIQNIISVTGYKNISSSNNDNNSEEDEDNDYLSNYQVLNEEEQSETEEEEKEEEEEEEKEEDKEEKEEEKEEKEEREEEKEEETEEEEEEIEEENVKEYNLFELFEQLHGPFKDFHSVSITPSILGCDKIVIRYLNDEYDETERTYIDNEVIEM
jgi:flagellar biosynthesis GTPase FlhF